ncbi:putative apoptosis-inducing factor [Xylariaceae sp. AK1471]|nr:putative apoptosis-inducing factor [Xylariaceae sp. AK1471]
MTRTVVVLGAGMAGLPIAHYLLRRTATKHPDLRVILVSPHDAFYWKIASVRFVLPDQMAEGKYMFPLAEQFASHTSSDRFELVIGAAEKLDPERNTVRIRLNGKSGELRDIEYHTLVVATGSRYRDDMPWKEVGTSAQTRASLAELRAGIRTARSIVVAGAGVTGVEFAGELGSAYGKGKEKTGRKKEITLVGADALPLAKTLRDSVRETAKHELEKLGVRYIGGAKMTMSSSPTSDDDWEKGGIKAEAKGARAITLTYADGSTQTLFADLVVPAFGVVPNTSFAPEGMRDATAGRLKQGTDLRAPGYKNVFVVGDAGNLQPPQAANTDEQVRHLMTQFDSYFSGQQIKLYVFDPNKTQMALTIGRDRGTGQVGSWQIWSILVWFLKGRHLGTDTAKDYARGRAGGMGRAWPN